MRRWGHCYPQFVLKRCSATYKKLLRNGNPTIVVPTYIYLYNINDLNCNNSFRHISLKL